MLGELIIVRMKGESELALCKNCKNEVTSSLFKPATTCRHCGVSNPATTRSDIVIALSTIGVLLVLLVAFARLGDKDDISKKPAAEEFSKQDQNFSDENYTEKLARSLFSSLDGENFKKVGFGLKGSVKSRLEFIGNFDKIGRNVNGYLTVSSEGQALNFVLKPVDGRDVVQPFNRLQLADYSFTEMKLSGREPIFKSGEMVFREQVINISLLKSKPDPEYSIIYENMLKDFKQAGYDRFPDYKQMHDHLENLSKLKPEVKKDKSERPVFTIDDL
jgi:hypothetical protein